MPHEETEGVIGFLWNKAVEAAKAVDRAGGAALEPVTNLQERLEAEIAEQLGDAWESSPLVTDFRLLLSHLGYQPAEASAHAHPERSTRRTPTTAAPMGTAESIAQLTETALTMAEGMGAAESPYYTALAEFVGVSRTGIKSVGQAMHEIGPAKFQPREYVKSDAGKLLYENGVLADPATNTVLYEPGSDAPGSVEWLANIQEEWTDEQADVWRKRLLKLGYVPKGGLGAKGGMGHDLLSGLQLFHETRYLNRGKVLKVTGEDRPIDIRKQMDFEAVKNEVGTWLEAVGFDADPDVSDFFAQQTFHTAKKLARRHPEWSPAQLQTGAQIRTQEKFVETPGVKGELRSLEEDEMDETLLQNMTSIMAVGQA